MVHIRKLFGDRLEKSTALRIFGICGIAGVLVDLDHAISLLLWWYHNPEVSEGRIWHTPLLIISCIGVCYLVSHLPGLHGKLVLISIATATMLVLLFSPWVVWSMV